MIGYIIDGSLGGDLLNRDIAIGMFLTVAGGLLWGLSGTAAQFLQQYRGIDAEWLVTVRMLVASIITVGYCLMRNPSATLKIFSDGYDVVRLLIFGVLGMALCQYSYFKTIFYAGAGIATVLQYLAPALLIIYMFGMHHKRPTINETLSVILAMVGTFLIAMKGKFSLAAIDGPVIFWGVLSAIAVAIYSAQPVPLLRKYGSGPIVGLGMLAGAIVASLLWHPLYIPGFWDTWTYMGMFCLIFLGTIVSFNIYLEGVRRIGAVKGSILSSVEPISAAFFSWLLVGNTFLVSDIIGFIMILSTVFILAHEKTA